MRGGFWGFGELGGTCGVLSVPSQRISWPLPSWLGRVVSWSNVLSYCSSLTIL